MSISGDYLSQLTYTLAANTKVIMVSAREPKTGSTFIIAITAITNLNILSAGHVQSISYDMTTNILKFTATMGAWNGTITYYTS